MCGCEDARGKLAVCRAEVQGTAIKADVILYCADAGEVGAVWLDALGPETPKPTEAIPGPDWDWDDEPGHPSKGSDGRIPGTSSGETRV